MKKAILAAVLAFGCAGTDFEEPVELGQVAQALSLGATPADFGSCFAGSTNGVYATGNGGNCTMPDKMPVKIRKVFSNGGSSHALKAAMEWGIDNAINDITTDRIKFQWVSSGEDVKFNIGGTVSGAPANAVCDGTITNHTPAPFGARGTCSHFTINFDLPKLQTEYMSTCVNNPAQCCIADFNYWMMHSVASHELGHTLGFGHGNYGGSNSMMVKDTWLDLSNENAPLITCFQSKKWKPADYAYDLNSNQRTLLHAYLTNSNLPE